MVLLEHWSVRGSRMEIEKMMEDNVSNQEIQPKDLPRTWWTRERMERRGSGDDMLRAELEEPGRDVGLGLELEDCPWEEVDVPQTEEGCTPLITACQRGMTEVVHFLLRKGADVTLCNHSNHTALHVSPPGLQRELLWSMFRPLPHHTQLLQAAWLGELHSLQHLLAQSDLVDVNCQNRDGLTPLMLAIRDIDLFEELGSKLPWEYRPVEVVRELVAASADLKVCDHQANSALDYVSHISSPIKDELLHMLVQALTPTAVTPLELQSFPPEVLWAPGHPPHPSLCHSALPQSSAEDEPEHSDPVLLSEHQKPNNQDKGIPLCFRGAMETLRDLRQTYQDVGKGSSKSGSLPSLWTDRGRHLDPSLASPGPLKTTGTACLPVPPKPRGRSESVAVPSLAVPQSSQLSQSAPSLMEPLMDPNSLLQARAHIQIRLVGCSETDRHFQGRKGSLPALQPTCSMPRTPKHLAPLAGRQGDRAALPRLRGTPPLKPIILTPLSSKARLRKDWLSRAGVRGPPLTRGGSEESSSSSTSSHSSIDLEEEEEDVDHKDDLSEQNIKNKMHLQSDKVHSQTRGNVVIHRGTNEHNYYREPVKCQSVEEQTVQTSKYVNETTPSHSTDLEAHNVIKNEPGVMMLELIQKTSPNMSRELTSDQSPFLTASALETHKGCKEVQIKDETCKGNTVDTKNPCLPARVNITLTKDIQPIKPIKIKDRRGSTSSQTNQSFNVLARKDHARGRGKPKTNGRTASVPSLLKAKVRHTPDLVVSGEASENPVKSRSSSSMAVPKITDASISPRKRVFEPPRPCIKRANLEKKTQNNKKVSAQKQASPGEPKSVLQPKKPGTLGTPRAKSAVDYIPYSDMFKEIHSGDEGPAIYEMFAGPVYDNVRVSSSCERCRTVQSAPLKKTPAHRAKYKYPKKPLESSRRKKSPVERLTSCKAKARARVEPPPTPASPEESGFEVATSGLDWQFHPSMKEIDPSEDDDGVRNSPNTAELLVEDHTLSVIEEVQCDFGSKTLTPTGRPRGKTTPPLSQAISHTSRTNSEEASDTDDESLYVWECLRGKLTSDSNNRGSVGHLDCPAPIPSASPVQPKINTWTSGSCDGTMSPVFQKFLDDAGEGPLTDDLLRCLAEELISLDERDASLCPDNYDSHRREVRDSKEEKSVVKDATSPAVLSGSEEVMDDDITWTKGEVLGRGAYGTVYCGLTSHGQLIAVKQVTLDTADPETADKEYKRLQEEVDLLKTLRHHNIVGYLGTLLRHNVVSIFMEYVPGGSIASILHRFGPLPERVLALYTQQILEGVSFLHLNRVIHRDLKGNNVMLMPTGVVKLIDFGCARRLSYLNHSASRSELLKSVHGTPYWMAPEVINETGHGRKSDIWSVGCTVFEMATGKPPLSHMDKMAALFYIGARRGLMPSLPEGFSREARDFVQVCLTSDQNLRPTAEQLLEHAFIPKERGLNLG